MSKTAREAVPSRRKESASQAPEQLLARWCARAAGTPVRVHLEGGDIVHGVTSSRAWMSKRGPMILISGIRGAQPLARIEVLA